MNALILSLVLILHSTYSIPLTKGVSEQFSMTEESIVFETTETPVTEPSEPTEIPTTNANENLEDKEELHAILGPAFNAVNADIGEVNNSKEKQTTVEYRGSQVPLMITIPIYIYVYPENRPQILTEQLELLSFGQKNVNEKANAEFLTPTAIFNRLPLEEDGLEISIPFQRGTNRHRSANHPEDT